MRLDSATQISPDPMPQKLQMFPAASCGWPLPTTDFNEAPLSLDELVGVNASSTFFARARGLSMINAGIHDGDVLVVDRSKHPTDGDVIVAIVDGAFTVKRLGTIAGQPALIPDNDSMKPLVFSAGEEVSVWGKVTWVLHKL